MNNILLRHGHFILAALALFAALALGSTTVHADTGSQISIAGNGQIIVRDAKITAKSGNSYTVSTGWGASTISWTVRTTGSTRFVPAADDIQKQIKVGDTVSFTGVLDSSARFTLTASAFKDTTLFRVGEIIGGTIQSIDTDSKEFVIIGDTGTTTVSTTSGTIFTRDGDQASLSDLIVGDKVKASGNMNMISQILTADRVSYSNENRVVESGSLGWWGKFLSYFGSSNAGISARDR